MFEPLKFLAVVIQFGKDAKKWSFTNGVNNCWSPPGWIPYNVLRKSSCSCLRNSPKPIKSETANGNDTWLNPNNQSADLYAIQSLRWSEISKLAQNPNSSICTHRLGSTTLCTIPLYICQLQTLGCFKSNPPTLLLTSFVSSFRLTNRRDYAILPQVGIWL